MQYIIMMGFPCFHHTINFDKYLKSVMRANKKNIYDHIFLTINVYDEETNVNKSFHIYLLNTVSFQSIYCA